LHYLSVTTRGHKQHEGAFIDPQLALAWWPAGDHLQPFSALSVVVGEGDDDTWWYDLYCAMIILMIVRTSIHTLWCDLCCTMIILLIVQTSIHPAGLIKQLRGGEVE